MKLIDAIKSAGQNEIAIGHFNFSTLETYHAIIAGAKLAKQAVILGLSAGERKFVGTEQAVALVACARQTSRQSIFLNADHVHSLVEAEEVVRAGFDAVTFDLSHLPLEENIKQSALAVKRLKAINPDVVIEGEIGQMLGESRLLDQAPEIVDLTAASVAKKYLDATGVDLLAPAVGNFHGLAKSSNKEIVVEQIREIFDRCQAPLVLHGGSGVADEQLTAAISAGVRIIHFNTELRLAWRFGLVSALTRRPAESAPYRLLADSQEEVRRVVIAKLKILAN